MQFERRRYRHEHQHQLLERDNKVAECPLNGGSSDEFTVPPQGWIKVALRAAMHVGETRTVVNLFIGTKADYEALMRFTDHRFLAGDLMPIA